MPHIKTTHTELYYEDQGNPDDPVIILIMGLATQMIAWPPSLKKRLINSGYRLISFDNRDAGLSAKHGPHKPNLLKHFAAYRLRLRTHPPYTLTDMANDVIDLMDALGIKQAHLVGASMGGMIAQIMASTHKRHVLSLTSVMSSSGHHKLPMPKKRVMLRLLKRPKLKGKEAYIHYSLQTYRMIESPAYPKDESHIRAYIEAAYERCYYPNGYLRQLAAILSSGDRSELLKEIECPTLVIHGKEDPLSPVHGGVHTALQVKGAKLALIDGMGHNLPEPLVPKISELIIEHLHDATDLTPPHNAHPKRSP